MSKDEELGDLRELIASRGWAWIIQYAKNDLDKGYLQKVSILVKQGGDIEAIRQLTAIRDYVFDVLLKAPYLQIETLERAEEHTIVPAGHRRGKAV